MRDPGQTMRFNSVELALLKSVFAENDEALFLIRRVLMQAPLSKQDRDWVATLPPNVWDVLAKVFIPTMDYDAPLFQAADMYMNLATDLKGLSMPDAKLAWPLIASKDIEVRYMRQQMNVLKDLYAEAPIKLADLMPREGVLESQAEETMIAVKAWAFLLSYIDSNIAQIKTLAGLKAESVEETKKRLAKASNK